MKRSAFFVACGSLALCLVTVHARAQLSPRAEPKFDIPPAVPPLDPAFFKKQQEMIDGLNRLGKEPLIPPLNLKPPVFTGKDWALRKPGSPMPQQAAPEKEYNPGTRARTPGAANPPSQALAPPTTQPATPERKPQARAAPAAPAKPPCVYKAVMSDDELAACR